jgi:hypothetical protein
MQDIPKETFKDMSSKSQMSVVFDYQRGQTGILNAIHKTLVGKDNGDDGLVTQTALNKQSISRVWKVVLILFPGTLTVIGIFVGILKFWG